MRLKNVDFEDKNNWLKITDFENTFQIYTDRRGNSVYNLNTTTFFDVDDDSMREFICDCDMFWPLISYKLYGTAHLWWLLTKLNKVDTAHIFDIKHSGDKIKYLDRVTVNELVSDINELN